MNINDLQEPPVRIELTTARAQFRGESANRRPDNSIATAGLGVNTPLSRRFPPRKCTRSAIGGTGRGRRRALAQAAQHDTWARSIAGIPVAEFAAARWCAVRGCRVHVPMTGRRGRPRRFCDTHDDPGLLAHLRALGLVEVTA